MNRSRGDLFRAIVVALIVIAGLAFLREDVTAPIVPGWLFVYSMEATIIGVGLPAGILIGRWWSVVLAVPAGLYGQSAYSFEGFSDDAVGLLYGITAAIGLVAGTAVRKLVTRRRAV